MVATVEVRDGRPVVVRTGAGGDASAIRREAGVLAAIAGPGAPAVLEFVDDGDQATLVVAVAPPLNLERAPLGVVLDALARVAEVLARANRAGIGHGPVRDDDVLGSATGVTLSGWQRVDADPDHDIAEFGRLVERLAIHHGELTTVATRALAPNPPTFTALASALRVAIPHASRSSRRVRPHHAVAALAVIAAIGVTLVATPSRRARPLVLNAQRRVSVHGNVVERDGRRWAVGRPGDLVVTGAWRCDGRQLPALLRPQTGRVWVFTSWPTGAAPVIAHAATDVPGAVRLRVERGAGCEHLGVVDDQGRTTVVR